MLLQLLFENAIEISQHGKREKLKLTVLNPEVFLSESTFKFIPEGFNDEKNIPVQLPVTLETEVLEVLANVLLLVTGATVVSHFVSNIAIAGTLNYLWSMINCLQIMAHFPLINILMPANCQLIFLVVVKIATFDLLPIDGLMDKISEMIDNERVQNPDLNESFYEMGYESTDPVRNLQINFILMLVLIVIPVLLKAAELLTCKNEEALNKIKEFKRT